jgi:hypothetical protein
MISRKALFLLGLILAVTGIARAADSGLVGKWKAEFDTQIGLQKYTYVFAVEDGKLTGKATFSHSMGEGDVALRDIKVEDDKVSFVEPFSFDGNEIPISYTGKLAGDELKLTRNVGDFATEELVAKRVKPTDDAAAAAGE